MSFLKKIFGGKGSDEPAAAPAATAEVEYKGFTLRATPRKEQGQYLVAGTIERTVDGVVRHYEFVRADRSPDRDEISEMSLSKARLIVDQQADSLFSEPRG